METDKIRSAHVTTEPPKQRRAEGPRSRGFESNYSERSGTLFSGQGFIHAGSKKPLAAGRYAAAGNQHHIMPPGCNAAQNRRNTNQPKATSRRVGPFHEADNNHIDSADDSVS